MGKSDIPISRNPHYSALFTQSVFAASHHTVLTIKLILSLVLSSTLHFEYQCMFSSFSSTQILGTPRCRDPIFIFFNFFFGSVWCINKHNKNVIMSDKCNSEYLQGVFLLSYRHLHLNNFISLNKLSEMAFFKILCNNSPFAVDLLLIYLPFVFFVNNCRCMLLWLKSVYVCVWGLHSE